MIVVLYMLFGNLLITYLGLAIILTLWELLLLLFNRDSDYSDFLVEGIKVSALWFVAVLPIVLILGIFV